MHVRDRWAGGTYYTICILILGFVGVYSVWLEHSYLSFQTLTGSVRASMSVAPAGSRAVPQDLDYCVQRRILPEANSTFIRMPCMDSGKDTTHFSRTQSSSDILIGSRVTAKPQTRNAACDDSWTHATGHDCSPWVTTPPSEWHTYFIADIEASNVLIQHSASVKTAVDRQERVPHVSSLGMDRPNATLHGTNATVTTTKLVGGDQVSVRDLLMVSGVVLDVAHGSDELNQGYGQVNDTTLRYQGVSLIVNIEYDPFVVGRYSYHVRIADIEGVFVYEDWEHMPGVPPQRVLVNLHGIHIFFEQSGGLYLFSATALIASLVNGFVLVGIAQTLTYLVLCYVAPMFGCHSSRLYLYEQTPNLAPRTQGGRERLQVVLNDIRRTKQQLCELDDDTKHRSSAGGNDGTPRPTLSVKKALESVHQLSHKRLTGSHGNRINPSGRRASADPKLLSSAPGGGVASSQFDDNVLVVEPEKESESAQVSQVCQVSHC